MKKILPIALSVVVIAGIVAVLANNKKKNEEKNSQNVVQSVFPVKAVEVHEQQRTDKLSLVGTVIANADVNIAAETGGRVIKRNIEVGQYVSSGSVLYELDNEVKLSQLKVAEANFDKAQKDSARIRYLVGENSMAAAQWDAIELQYKLAEQQLIQARRAVNDTRIKAPVSGYVNARQADVGMMLSQGNVVCNIVDVSRLKVRVNVSENDILKLKTGDKVSIANESAATEAGIVGTISAISVKADEAHTYPIEITLSSAANLKVGMFVRVSFSQVEKGTTLVIPREAVIGSIRDAKVFVAEGDKARLRPVKLGNDVEGNIEVVGGLRQGERVITTGQNTIGDGYTIKLQ